MLRTWKTKVVSTGPLPRGARCADRDSTMKRVVEWDSSSMFSATNVEAVNLGGEARGDRGGAALAALGDLAGGAGGIGRDDAFDPELADEVAALAERHDVALHRFDLGELHALER